MDIIDSENVVIFNHTDLYDAVFPLTTYINVYLGGDITMTAGIRINAAKTALNIIGYDPRDPSRTIRTLTGFDSSTDTGTLYVSQSSTIQISFQDISITGRNYYGVPCIHAVTGSENVSVTYQNVSFVGPQIIWHPLGITRFFDCDIIIDAGYSVSNEVGEVNRLFIGGNTTIRHNTTTNAVFFFYGANASFTVMTNAVVDITSLNVFYYRVYNVPFVIEPGAKLTIATNNGFCWDDGHHIASILVDENALFHYRRLTQNGYTANTMSVAGTITLNKGADMMLIVDVAGNNGAALRMTTSSPRLQCNDPKRFAVYNSGTGASSRAFIFLSTMAFDFTTQQVNYWQAATPFPSAGTFEDYAPWRWHKTNWEAFTMNGTADNAGTTVANTSLSSEEREHLDELNLYTAKVFSLGNVPLKVNTIVTDMRPITGNTLPIIDVMAEYLVDPYSMSGTCISEADGSFILELTDPIPFNTAVTVAANLQFLITAVTLEALDPGELGIAFAPAEIQFIIDPISLSPILLPRAIPEEEVVISDERVDVDRTPWELFASVDGPLTSATGEILPESVIFIRKGETTPLTLDANPQLVHADGPYEEMLTPITWTINEGVLARITTSLRNGVRYSALLTWEVRPAAIPPNGGEPA